MNFTEGTNFFLLAAPLVITLYTGVLVNRHTSPESEKHGKRNSHLLWAFFLLVFLCAPLIWIKEKFDKSQEEAAARQSPGTKLDFPLNPPAEAQGGGGSAAKRRDGGDTSRQGSRAALLFDAINGKWSRDLRNCPGVRNSDSSNLGALWYEYEILGDNLIVRSYSDISSSEVIEKIVQQNGEGLKSVSKSREYFYDLSSDGRLRIMDADNKILTIMERCV